MMMNFGRWSLTLPIVLLFLLSGCASRSDTGAGSAGESDTTAGEDTLAGDTAETPPEDTGTQGVDTDSSEAATGDAATGDAAEVPPEDTGVRDADADSGTTSDTEDTEPDTIDPDTDDASDTGDAWDTLPEPDTEEGPPPLFDMERIQNTATIDCQFNNHRTARVGLQSVDLWDVSYNSFEVIDGELQTIRLQAFAARPAGKTNLPGVANIHGLGGAATESMATGSALTLDMFIIVPTGPGGGEPPYRSEGRPSSFGGGYRIFDSLDDPRGSWLWAHAVGAMRSLTCLSTHPGVDASRLGMTGFSAGGIATLISASVDDRIKAAVPLSGTGGWAAGVAPAKSWFRELLTLAGLSPTSPEWYALIGSIDPVELLGNAQAPIFLGNGSTDEFFPLTAHVATLQAIGDAVPWRTSISGNYDHGCYGITGVEDKTTIELRAITRAAGAQKAWFHHHFGSNAIYAHIPELPQLQVHNVAGLLGVVVQADPGDSHFRIDKVRFWASDNGSYIFAHVEIPVDANGFGAQTLPVAYTTDAVWYADVEYVQRSALNAERFSVSSVPWIPPDYVPLVRGIGDCL